MPIFNVKRMRVLVMSAMLLIAGRPCGPQPAPDVPRGNVMVEIGPILDGVLDRVIVRDGVVTYSSLGKGQSGGDGQIWQSSLEPGAKAVQIVYQGHNSPDAKEGRPYGIYPGLVARPANDLIVLNLICGEQFPASNEGTFTGNVVAYHLKTGTHSNLTKEKRKDRFVEALKWFPNEKVLLIEESKLRGSDTPAPLRGSGRPACMKLDGTRSPIEAWPAIQRWYQAWAGLRIKHNPVEEGGRQATEWTIEHTSVPNPFVIRSGDSYSMEHIEEHLHVLLVDHAGPLLLLGVRGSGTYLLNFQAGKSIIVSPHEAIDLDTEVGRLVLRSIQPESDGQFRYWVADLRLVLEGARLSPHEVR